MTSPKHGRLIEIFRTKPETLVEALRAWLGLEVPAHSKLEVTSGDLTLVNLKDLTADLVSNGRRSTSSS